MGIADDEGAEIHQHAAICVLGQNLATPQHRAREGLANRTPLIRIIGQGAERQVHFLDKHPPANAPQPDRPLRSDLSAVEADVVRAEPRHQSLDVEILVSDVRVVGRRELEKHLASLSIHVQCQ